MYLGLRPPKGVFHYPVIRTVKTGDIKPALAKWDEFTHILFTSQTTVAYWPGPWDKKLIAIGPTTARALGKKSMVANAHTQEGIAQLIERIQGVFFYPRTKLARPFLAEFMKKKRIPFFALDLYDTVFQRLEPVPNLDDFDEIIFTSPSTMDGFLRIYGVFPKNNKLTSIGPVTEKELITRSQI